MRLSIYPDVYAFKYLSRYVTIGEARVYFQVTAKMPRSKAFGKFAVGDKVRVSLLHLGTR